MTRDDVDLSKVKFDLDEELRYFEPIVEYGSLAEGTMYRHLPQYTQQYLVGECSNLIKDMCINGATREEIVKAVKHSMVLINARKYGLDWKKSEQDNDILELKKKYSERKNDEKSI